MVEVAGKYIRKGGCSLALVLLHLVFDCKKILLLKTSCALEMCAAVC